MKNGHLVATAADYQLARHLLLKPMERLLGGGVSEPARRFYERLAKWWPTGDFTSTAVKQKDTSSKTAVYGWLHELHEVGVMELVNAQRGNVPAIWRLSGKPLDDSASVSLPALDKLFPDMAWKRGHKAEGLMKS